jgi:hypothetical protein
MGDSVSAGIKIALNATKAIKNIDALIAQFPLAAARALNRTGVTARAVMAREISKDIGLAVSKVKDEIKTDQATSANLRVRVRVAGKRIPLIDFGAKGPEPSRGKGRGVSYRLKGGKGRLEHGFIATVGKGHRGVFMRLGTSRLPVKEKFGPSLPHVFSKYTGIGEVQGGLALRKNLQSELRFALNQGAKS